MNILEEIINYKKKEVEKKKSLSTIKWLEQSIFFESQTVSLKKYIQRPDKSGIIAEFKRKSPSLGMINEYASVEKVTIGYMQAGASALSVLTDCHFFGGKTADLTVARKMNYCPVLQKDFFVDEYQVTEAKSIGADAILLIAAVLEEKQLKKLAQLAKSLGLETILEIHEKEEFEKYNEYIDIVGVNNRNLKDFTVDISQSVKLSEYIPENTVRISESGIHSRNDIMKLKQAGFSGFLIGERFMKTSRPEIACARFIKEIGGEGIRYRGIGV